MDIFFLEDGRSWKEDDILGRPGSQGRPIRRFSPSQLGWIQLGYYESHYVIDGCLVIIQILKPSSVPILCHYIVDCECATLEVAETTKQVLI